MIGVWAMLLSSTENKQSTTLKRRTTKTFKYVYFTEHVKIVCSDYNFVLVYKYTWFGFTMSNMDNLKQTYLKHVYLSTLITWIQYQ